MDQMKNIKATLLYLVISKYPLTSVGQKYVKDLGLF